MMDKRKCLLIKGWEMIVRRKLKWVEAEINRHGSLGLAQTFFQLFFQNSLKQICGFSTSAAPFHPCIFTLLFFCFNFFLYEFVWLFVLLWNNAQLIEWKNSLYSRIFRSWFSSPSLAENFSLFFFAIRTTFLMNFKFSSAALSCLVI